MKILALIGSPKKTGHTIEQVKYFERQAIENQAVDFEYLFLNDYCIKECIGCNNCFDKGEKFCPLNDDLDKIINKIKECDGIVWVTPIYSLHISYLLKKLFDRFAFIHHRPAYHNKPACIIIVKGDQFSSSIKYVKECLQSWGFNITGKIGIPAIVNMPDKIRIKKLMIVKKEVNNLIRTINDNVVKKPNIIQLLSFKMWQLRASLQEKSNADYIFFRNNDLFDKKYFYKVNIGILNSILTPILFQLLVIYLKKEFGDLKKGL